MKHTTEYLYNVSPKEFMYLPYVEALNAKEYYAMRNMKRLTRLSKIVKNHEAYDLIFKNYKASERARDHNRELLEEVNS